MDTIYVDDINNPESIVTAFQEALDIVVANGGVKKLLAEKYNPYRYQNVHWREGEPPLGCVTMFTTGHRQTTTVFVAFKLPGSDVLLHEDFTRKVYLQFEEISPNPATTFPFLNNQGEYRASVALPSARFRRASRLQMMLSV